MRIVKDEQQEARDWEAFGHCWKRQFSRAWPSSLEADWRDIVAGRSGELCCTVLEELAKGGTARPTPGQFVNVYKGKLHRAAVASRPARYEPPAETCPRCDNTGWAWCIVLLEDGRGVVAEKIPPGGGGARVARFPCAHPSCGHGFSRVGDRAGGEKASYEDYQRVYQQWAGPASRLQFASQQEALAALAGESQGVAHG